MTIYYNITPGGVIVVVMIIPVKAVCSDILLQPCESEVNEKVLYVNR